MKLRQKSLPPKFRRLSNRLGDHQNGKGRGMSEVEIRVEDGRYLYVAGVQVVTVYGGRMRYSGTTGDEEWESAEVSWSALGPQLPETAREMAHALLKAADLADALNANAPTEERPEPPAPASPPTTEAPPERS